MIFDIQKTLGLFCALVPFSAQAVVFAEVYTARACEVCRPVEEMVAEFAHDEHVIAVALHVDYWDYILHDPFADPAFAARQVGYKEDDELKELATPQIIVQGQDSPERNDHAEEFSQLVDMHQSDFTLEVSIEEKSGVYGLSIDPAEIEKKELEVVWMQYFSDEEREEMREQARMDGDSPLPIVKNILLLGDWQSDEAFEAEIEAEEAVNGVLVVQEVETRGVVFAQELEL